MARRPKSILNGSTNKVVSDLGAILATGDPTKFAYMSACVYGVRLKFLELGHPWELSDWAAHRLVAAALARIGAQWPRWVEGQPEYTQDGFKPVERTRCIRCGGALPEGHRLYCSHQCCQSMMNWRWAKDRRAELAAYQRAYRAAKRTRELHRGGH